MTAPRAREANDPPAPPDRRPPRRGGGSSPSTYASSAAGWLRGLVRSGRRAVLAAAGLTAIVLATGLALAPPAQAQETIWSGTVTVGASGSVLGFLAPNCAGCTGYGSLSDRTFSYDGTNYNIRILDHTTNSPHWLRIRTLSNGFTSKTVADLYLVVDGVNFLLSDGSSSQSGKQRTWNNAGLNWSVGTDVSVSLKKFNRPEPTAFNVRGSGNKLWLFVNANLSNILPPTSAFTLTAAGSPVTIGSISLQTNLRTLDLTDFSPLIGAGQTVTLDYTDPSTGDDTNAIQDINGLDAASFSNVVVNDSAVTLPKPTAAAVPADGATVVLTFSRDSSYFPAGLLVRDSKCVHRDRRRHGAPDHGLRRFRGHRDADDVGHDRGRSDGRRQLRPVRRRPRSPRDRQQDTGRQLHDGRKQRAGGRQQFHGGAGEARERRGGCGRDAADPHLQQEPERRVERQGLVHGHGGRGGCAHQRLPGSQHRQRQLRLSFSFPVPRSTRASRSWSSTRSPPAATASPTRRTTYPSPRSPPARTAFPRSRTLPRRSPRRSPDTAASTSKVGTGGSGLVLAFDGPLATDNAPPASAFSITAGGGRHRCRRRLAVVHHD